MTLADLRKRFRARTMDQQAPYFWSNPEVDALINEAYHEAVDRGLMIFDRDSFQVEFELGVTKYPLDQSIIRVKGADIISKDGVALDVPEPMQMAAPQDYPSDRMYSEPHGFWIDEDGMFVLASLPTSVSVAQLTVHRYPKTLVNDADEPEIPEFYHEKMLDWAIKRGLLKNDADTFSQISSDVLDAEFTRVFGPPKTAQQHRQRRRHIARSRKTNF